MKKIYEAPKMLVEEIYVELPLAASASDLPVFGGDNDPKVDGLDKILTKDRKDGDLDLW